VSRVPDTPSLLAAVQENYRRLNSCAKHQFAARGNNYRIGMKLTCQNCGGTMSLTDAGHYLRGYVAHGGQAQDIIPDWPEKKS